MKTVGWLFDAKHSNSRNCIAYTCYLFLCYSRAPAVARRRKMDVGTLSGQAAEPGVRFRPGVIAANVAFRMQELICKLKEYDLDARAGLLMCRGRKLRICYIEPKLK